MTATKTLILLVSCLLSPLLQAHGSVTAEGDLCLIRIGFYTAHFKVFQPQSSGAREYCEDLPEAGESVFIMDYVHQGLGQAPIEFRIIRDTTGLGRFARLADVLRLGDLEPLTVFHQAPVLEPGVFTALHAFAEEGAFLGVVSVRHPETGELYQAIFPFSVGARDWGLLPLFAALALLAQGGYWVSTGGYARWRARRVAAVPGAQVRLVALLPLLLLMGAAAPPAWTSASGELRASFSSDTLPIPLNRIHMWTLHIETADGSPLEHAQVTVDGGMPAHRHGLPTAPIVSVVGAGDYRIEGLRFHMQGAWELTVKVEQAGTRDTIVIPLTL
ncbi:MAG: hypothetical protein RLZZ227_1660 [Pseudomonadota bacterium]